MQESNDYTVKTNKLFCLGVKSCTNFTPENTDICNQGASKLISITSSVDLSSINITDIDMQSHDITMFLF